MLMAISILGALYAQGRPARAATCRSRCRMRCCSTSASRSPRRHRTGNKAARRAGAQQRLRRANPPMGMYPTKGGGSNDYVYVFTSRANPEHWRRLLKVIGREELIGDPRFATPEARAERADEVNEMIAEWTTQHTKHEAMQIIGAAGVPAGAVLDTLEL